MTQFASRLVDDFMPYFVAQAEAHLNLAGLNPNDDTLWNQQLQEEIDAWNRVEHNEPNPILIEFRSAWEFTYPEHRIAQAESYLDYLDGDVYEWQNFSRDIHEHARRVLTRLARFIEGDE